MSHKVTSTCSSGKALLIGQEKVKTFNVGQAFGKFISPGVWGIPLAGNKIVRVAMFMHHARSPLLVVQEKLKTFNVGQAFETQLELHKIFTDSHFHQITCTGSSGKA